MLLRAEHEQALARANALAAENDQLTHHEETTKDTKASQREEYETQIRDLQIQFNALEASKRSLDEKNLQLQEQTARWKEDATQAMKEAKGKEMETRQQLQAEHRRSQELQLQIDTLTAQIQVNFFCLFRLFDCFSLFSCAAARQLSRFADI